MKVSRITAVFAVIFTLICLAACSAVGTDGGKEIKYKLRDDRIIITQLPSATGITEIVIPDEINGIPVTEIADFAGSNLEYAEKITIGKNIENIGLWAFTNDQQLREFVTAGENRYFTAVDGVLFTSDMKTLISCPPAAFEKYDIPETVETVRAKAFYKCGALKEISFPDGLKTIEEKAFFRCSELTDFVLPSALEKIEKDAFGYCTSLTQLSIPASIGEIGDYAFYNCTEVKKVSIQKNEADIILGKNWQPTNNGLEIDGLEISFTGN